MDNKFKKIMAVTTVFLFLGMTAGSVIAEETDKNNQKVTLTYSTLGNDDSLVEKTASMSKSDFEDFKGLLSKLLEKISQMKSYEEIVEILLNNSILEEKYPILYGLIEKMAERRENRIINKPVFEKKLVISQGWGYNLNLFKDNKFRLTKKSLMMWHYGNNAERTNIESGTFIFDLGPLVPSTIKGRQIGFMAQFRGIHIYRAKPINAQSYTFFLGFAKFANALEIPTLIK